MAAFPNLNKSIFKTDYGLNEINPGSLPLFDYTGSLTEVAGGYLGNDPTKGAFTWSPFQMAQSTGGIDGPGKWTDGGWVADPTNYWGIYQSGDPGMGRSALSGHTAANIPLNDPNTELVRMPDGTWGYRRWGADLPVQRHDPAHSSFDAIADFWMPVIGSAIVGGAGAGLWGAGAAEGVGAAGAAGGAMDMGIGLGEVYGIGQGAAAGAGGAMDMGIGTQGWMDYLGTQAAGAGAGGLSGAIDWTNTVPIEEMGNFTGGGALGSNYTWGQIGQSLGYPNLSSLMNGGSMSTGDLMTLITKLGPSVLGMVGSDAQADAIGDVAKNQAALQQQAQAMGAPYRAEALKMLNDPNSFFSGPVAQSNLAGVLQGLSVNGNPFGNPTSLALAQQGQRGLYNSTLANLGTMGGLSGYNAAGASQALGTQLALQQAMQQGQMWNAAGAGLNSIVNPQPTLADIVKLLQGSGTGFSPSLMASGNDAGFDAIFENFLA